MFGRQEFACCRVTSVVQVVHESSYVS